MSWLQTLGVDWDKPTWSRAATQPRKSFWVDENVMIDGKEKCKL